MTDRSITSGGTVGGMRKIIPATKATTRVIAAMESVRFMGQPNMHRFIIRELREHPDSIIPRLSEQRSCASFARQRNPEMITRPPALRASSQAPPMYFLEPESTLN